MARQATLIGQKFGHLTVIEKYDVKNKQSRWKCSCDLCGGTCIAYTSNLKSGFNTSCGCNKSDMGKEQMRQTSVSLDRLHKDASDPYQNLANAIVAVAADDYRGALKSGNDKLLESLDKFFHSSWYRTLTGVDSDVLLGMLKREHRGNLRAVYI